jgi:hypothetical protein
VQLKTMSTVDNGEALLKNVAQIGVRIWFMLKQFVIEIIYLQICSSTIAEYFTADYRSTSPCDQCTHLTVQLELHKTWLSEARGTMHELSQRCAQMEAQCNTFVMLSAIGGQALKLARDCVQVDR